MFMLLKWVSDRETRFCDRNNFLLQKRSFCHRKKVSATYKKYCNRKQKVSVTETKNYHRKILSQKKIVTEEEKKYVKKKGQNITEKNFLHRKKFVTEEENTVCNTKKT